MSELELVLFVAAEGRWQTCVRKMQLMPVGHSDENCESYFTITTKQVGWRSMHCLMYSGSSKILFNALLCFIEKQEMLGQSDRPLMVFVPGEEVHFPKAIDM